MKFKTIKKIIPTLILTGIISVFPSCQTEVPENKNTINTRLKELIKIDKDFEPDLEKKIEENFKVNILGESQNLDDKSLSNAYEDLTKVGKKMPGLNIVIGEVIDNSDFGEYANSTDFGPTIFVKKINKGGITFKHEIFHHLHNSLEKKYTFDEEWGNIKTKIYDKGKILEITTKEAIYFLNALNKDSWILTNKEGKNFEIRGGLFGFISPYSIQGKNYGSKDIYAEDVATFSEILLLEQSGPNPLTFGDECFYLETYLKKINLLEKYDFIDPGLAEKTKKNLEEKSSIFLEIQNGNGSWFEEMKQKILSEKIIPSCYKMNSQNKNILQCTYKIKSEEFGDNYEEHLITSYITSPNTTESSLNAWLNRSKKNLTFSESLIYYNSSCNKEDGCLERINIYKTDLEKRIKYNQEFSDLINTLQKRQNPI